MVLMQTEKFIFAPLSNREPLEVIGKKNMLTPVLWENHLGSGGGVRG